MIGCDLGTNTLRIVQIDCKSKQRIKEFEKIVRTGQNLNSTGIISDESIKNILLALYDASLIFDFKSEKTKCVTTEAMRVAKNSNEVLRKIKDKFNLEFEVISGEVEASYTLIGVRNSLKLLDIDDDDFCLFDLGGGSTELSYVHHDKISSKSFQFGILNISEKYKNTKDLTEGINLELKPVIKFAKNNKKPSILIATAGTPTTVCAFLQKMDYNSYNHNKVNGKSLHVKDFKKAYKEILSLDFRERERFCGVNRSELIKTGILIVINLMNKLKFEECIVIDDGLREGLALSLCSLWLRT